MRIPTQFLARSLAGLLLAFAAVSAATGSDIPRHGKAVVLFSGRDLGNFDTFLTVQGLNNDPDRVFRVENDVIHVSGKEFGYIITKKEFANYYLRAEFKWGEGTYAPREGQARDSGILYHVQGPQKVWPTSDRVSDSGRRDRRFLDDRWRRVDRNGWRAGDRSGRQSPEDRPHRQRAGKNVTGFRDPVGEVEKPHGEWNLLELVVQGDHVKQFVNGKLANEGSGAYPSSGKILFQSEGAEIFFRNIKLYPLKSENPK